MGRVVVAVLCLAGCRYNFVDQPDAPPGGGDDDGSTDGPFANTPCPTWCAETSPTSENLLGVWARSPNDVWAVGANGTVMRRRDGVWTMLPQQTTLPLRSVWLAPDADEAFVVGGNDVRIRYQGDSPSMQMAANGLLFGVWGADRQNVYAVGDSSRVYRWDGSMWTMVAGVTGFLSTVHGASSPLEVWIGSTGNDMYRSTSATTFMPINVPAPDVDWFDVWVGSPTNVWIVGYENMHWNGSVWTEYFAPDFMYIFDTIYSDGNNVWVGGPDGVVGWFDGTQFIKLTTPMTQGITSIHGVGDEVWAVGDAGAIIRFKK